MENSKKRGKYGEDAACDYIESLGYSIVERNFTVRYGEIDIIAKDGECTVFVEVKLRKNTQYGLACEAVGTTKQHKIINAAKMWIVQTLYGGETRFDVIEVYQSKGNPPRINHIKNAFWVNS